MSTIVHQPDFSDLTNEKMIDYLKKLYLKDITQEKKYNKEQLIEMLTEYMKNLLQKDWDDLKLEYDEKKRVEELFEAFKGIGHDKYRFFNQPEANADFIHYCQRKTWTKEEAVALSFGKDPVIVNLDKLNKYMNDPNLNKHGSSSSFIRSYKKRLDILNSDSTLSDIASPDFFLTWFNNNRIPVPDYLKTVTIDFGIQKAEQFLWIEQIFEDLDETQKKDTMSFSDTEDASDIISFGTFMPNFTTKAGFVAKAMRNAICNFIKANNSYPTEWEIWDILKNTPLEGFRIETGKHDTIIVEDAKPINREAFKKRWSRYTRPKSKSL